MTYYKDIVLKKYPTYTLLGRIAKKDIKLFEKTHDESLILYKFCANGREYVPNNDNVKRKKPGSPLNPR
jgi:hypothetical protein